MDNAFHIQAKEVVGAPSMPLLRARYTATRGAMLAALLLIVLLSAKETAAVKFRPLDRDGDRVPNG